MCIGPSHLEKKSEYGKKTDSVITSNATEILLRNITRENKLTKKKKTRWCL